MAIIWWSSFDFSLGLSKKLKFWVCLKNLFFGQNRKLHQITILQKSVLKTSKHFLSMGHIDRFGSWVSKKLVNMAGKIFLKATISTLILILVYTYRFYWIVNSNIPCPWENKLETLWGQELWAGLAPLAPRQSAQQRTKWRLVQTCTADFVEPFVGHCLTFP